MAMGLRGVGSAISGDTLPRALPGGPKRELKLSHSAASDPGLSYGVADISQNVSMGDVHKTVADAARLVEDVGQVKLGDTMGANDKG